MSGLRSGKHEPRYKYGPSFESKHAADDYIESLYAEGWIDNTDSPQVEYVGGTRPWIITLLIK